MRRSDRYDMDMLVEWKNIAYHARHWNGVSEAPAKGWQQRIWNEDITNEGTRPAFPLS
jgi:hypothetical protein